jgi:hypothetical protein
MRARLAYALLVLTLLGAAGCAARSRQAENASAGGLPGRDDCIWVLYIDKWETIDPSTLLVYTANNSFFLVKLAQPVADLTNHDAAGFYASNHDDRVCGNGADLLVRASDRLRDPLVAVRSIKASQARQFQKTITPTTASAAATTPSRSGRRRNSARAAGTAPPPADTTTPAAGTAASPADTGTPPADTATSPPGTATPSAGASAQPAASP